LKKNALPSKVVFDVFFKFLVVFYIGIFLLLLHTDAFSFCLFVECNKKEQRKKISENLSKELNHFPTASLSGTDGLSLT
jgi:hypothetical protein